MSQKIRKFVLFIVFVFSVSCGPARNSTNGDVGPCLKEFYSSAYKGNYNCTKEFNFFSEDPTTQQKSFINGKACFLEVVQEQCTNAQYNLISTKYDQFSDVITKKPSNETDCSISYFTYNALKCEPMMVDITLRTTQLASIDTKVNDSRVLEAISLCQEVENCMKPTCYFTDLQKSMISDDCEGINMKNSEFMSCQWKFKKETPDLSGYSCLDGFDFYDAHVIPQIDKFTRKSKCTREIMEDYCGESAGNNFDKYATITVKHLEIYAQRLNSINQ